MVGCGMFAGAGAGELSPCSAGCRRAKLDLLPRAHWTFNEPSSAGNLYASSGDKAVSIRPDRSLDCGRGVYGSALDLSGSYQLPVETSQLWEGLTQITLSLDAPISLSSYREIFRQEFANRVLFSYQNDGTVLSLGLNIGGYVECDAAIRPSEVLDGQWHHAAATFDGHAMCVYLDGNEIGSLSRKGPLSLQADVPAFVGSSAGHGEFFQGSLDDLRIYPVALTAEQIGQLHQHGTQSLALASMEVEAELVNFYCDRRSFAATLAESRQRLAVSVSLIANWVRLFWRS